MQGVKAKRQSQEQGRFTDLSSLLLYTDTQTQTHTETHTDTETHTQTHTGTQTQRHRHTHTQTREHRLSAGWSRLAGLRFAAAWWLA